MRKLLIELLESWLEALRPAPVLRTPQGSLYYIHSRKVGAPRHQSFEDYSKPLPAASPQGS